MTISCCLLLSVSLSGATWGAKRVSSLSRQRVIDGSIEPISISNLASTTISELRLEPDLRFRHRLDDFRYSVETACEYTRLQTQNDAGENTRIFGFFKPTLSADYDCSKQTFLKVLFIRAVNQLNFEAELTGAVVESRLEFGFNFAGESSSFLVDIDEVRQQRNIPASLSAFVKYTFLSNTHCRAIGTLKLKWTIYWAVRRVG